MGIPTPRRYERPLASTPVVGGERRFSGCVMRAVAARKHWLLLRVTERLQHDQIHAVDCEACVIRSGEIDRLAPP